MNLFANKKLTNLFIFMQCNQRCFRATYRTTYRTMYRTTFLGDASNDECRVVVPIPVVDKHPAGRNLESNLLLKSWSVLLEINSYKFITRINCNKFIKLQQHCSSFTKTYNVAWNTSGYHQRLQCSLPFWPNLRKFFNELYF